jgi:hypothetical protein
MKFYENSYVRPKKGCCDTCCRVRSAKQELGESSTRSRMVRIALDKSAEEFRWVLLLLRLQLFLALEESVVKYI